MEQIEILLSTYFGAEFLEQQINSLLNQSYKDIRITIRDDGSNDSTISIIKNYIERFPHQINLMPGCENIGSKRSFMKLLENATSDYIMFCDQDDVWLPDKVLDTLIEMRRLEQLYGSEYPLLVFTDLIPTDANLQPIATSLWHMQRLDPHLTLFWKKLLAQNVVTGCTIMVKKNICPFLAPFASLTVHHDQLIAVVASKYGHISWIDRPTIYYRQHDRNVVGASKFNFKYIFDKIKNIKNIINFFIDASNCFEHEINIIELFYLKILINISRAVKK